MTLKTLLQGYVNTMPYFKGIQIQPYVCIYGKKKVSLVLGQVTFR